MTQNTKIVFTENPTQSQIDSFESFSDAHWGDHFHEDDSSADFFATPNLVAEFYVDSTLVSGMVIFFRTLNYQGQTYSFIGIGGVVTHQEYRHHGYATQLLKKVIEDLTPRFDFAMLCTDIKRLGGLYELSGFLPIGRPYFFIDKNGLKKPEVGGMIAPLSSPEVVNKILKTSDEIFVGTSNF